MKKYQIKHLNTPDWSQVPAVTLEHTGWLAPCPIAASAQLCHNGDTLFVRMEAAESDIRATLTGTLDQVCCDSCLEFFFAPDCNDKRYFNFECNPLGTLYLGFGAERGKRIRQIVDDTAMFHIQPFTTEKGWGITYQIPLDYIRIYFPNASFRGEAFCNFYKCGDETTVPHYLAWSPLTGATPDYHRRQDFGQIVFE